MSPFLSTVISPYFVLYYYFRTSITTTALSERATKQSQSEFDQHLQKGTPLPSIEPTHNEVILEIPDANTCHYHNHRNAHDTTGEWHAHR